MSLLRKLFVCSRTSTTGRGEQEGGGKGTSNGSETEAGGQREEAGECAVCQDKLQEACTLPCGNRHVFCLTCLKGVTAHSPHRSHFPCPLCRKRVRVPLGGVAAFRNHKTLGQKLCSKLPAVRLASRRGPGHQRRDRSRSGLRSMDFLTVSFPVPLGYSEDLELDILSTLYAAHGQERSRSERLMEVLMDGIGQPRHRREQGAVWLSEHLDHSDSDREDDAGDLRLQSRSVGISSSGRRFPGEELELVGAEELDMSVVLQIIADMEEDQRRQEAGSDAAAAGPAPPQSSDTGGVRHERMSDTCHGRSPQRTENIDTSHRPETGNATSRPETPPPEPETSPSQRPDTSSSQRPETTPRRPETAYRTPDRPEMYSCQSEQSESGRALSHTLGISDATSLKPDSAAAPSERLHFDTSTRSDTHTSSLLASESSHPRSLGSADGKASLPDTSCSLSRATGVAAAQSSGSRQSSTGASISDGLGGPCSGNSQSQHVPEEDPSDLRGYNVVLRPRMGSFKLAIAAGQRSPSPYEEDSPPLFPSTPPQGRVFKSQAAGLPNSTHFPVRRNVRSQPADKTRTEVEGCSSKIQRHPNTNLDPRDVMMTQGNGELLAGMMDRADRDEQLLLAVMDSADRPGPREGETRTTAPSSTSPYSALRNNPNRLPQTDPRLQKPRIKDARKARSINEGLPTSRQSCTSEMTSQIPQAELQQQQQQQQKQQQQQAQHVGHDRPALHKEQASNITSNIADGLQPKQRRLQDRSGPPRWASTPSDHPSQDRIPRSQPTTTTTISDNMSPEGTFPCSGGQLTAAGGKDADDSEEWTRRLRGVQHRVISQTCKRLFGRDGDGGLQEAQSGRAESRRGTRHAHSVSGTPCAEDRLHVLDTNNNDAVEVIHV